VQPEQTTPRAIQSPELTSLLDIVDADPAEPIPLPDRAALGPRRTW
jgi:hypothetical protein